MKIIHGYVYEDDSWWGVRTGAANADSYIAEVNYMSQGKTWAVHLESDKLSEMRAKLVASLAEVDAQLAGAPAGKAPAAPKAEPKTPETKAATPAASASKTSLEDVMTALTKLRDAVDAPDNGAAKNGLAAVKEVLKGFKVTNSKNLTPEQYDAVIAAAGKAEAAAATDGEDF